MGAPGLELLTRAFRDVSVRGKPLGGFLLGSTLQMSMVLFPGGPPSGSFEYGWNFGLEMLLSISF